MDFGVMNKTEADSGTAERSAERGKRLEILVGENGGAARREISQHPGGTDL